MILITHWCFFHLLNPLISFIITSELIQQSYNNFNRTFPYIILFDLNNNITNFIAKFLKFQLLTNGFKTCWQLVLPILSQSFLKCTLTGLCISPLFLSFVSILSLETWFCNNKFLCFSNHNSRHFKMACSTCFAYDLLKVVLSLLKHFNFNSVILDYIPHVKAIA